MPNLFFPDGLQAESSVQICAFVTVCRTGHFLSSRTVPFVTICRSVLFVTV